MIQCKLVKEYNNYYFDDSEIWCWTSAVRNQLTIIANHAALCEQGLIECLVLVAKLCYERIDILSTTIENANLKGESDAEAEKSMIVMEISRVNCVAGLRLLTFNTELRHLVVDTGGVDIIIRDSKRDVEEQNLDIGVGLLQEIEAESWENGIRGITLKDGRADDVPMLDLYEGQLGPSSSVKVDYETEQAVLTKHLVSLVVQEMEVNDSAERAGHVELKNVQHLMARLDDETDPEEAAKRARMRKTEGEGEAMSPLSPKRAFNQDQLDGNVRAMTEDTVEIDSDESSDDELYRLQNEGEDINTQGIGINSPASPSERDSPSGFNGKSNLKKSGASLPNLTPGPSTPAPAGSSRKVGFGGFQSPALVSQDDSPERRMPDIKTPGTPIVGTTPKRKKRPDPNHKFEKLVSIIALSSKTKGAYIEQVAKGWEDLSKF
jgi:hypothetical protein